MAKYYAVKVGVLLGIYTTWDDCKKQVNGYKGAIYKSFGTLEEAEIFLSNNIEKKSNTNNEVVDNYAYIDGSYDNDTKVYGSGIVIVTPKNKIFKKIANNNANISDLRNVAGEIEAVKYVLNYCLENNLKEITIFYDYAGIENWVTGDWKANLEYTKDYALFAQEVIKKVNVKFVKVKAHSGIELNELADKLAKESIKEFNDKSNDFIFGSKEDNNLIESIKNNIK